MTVKELIEELQKLDPDKYVYYEDSHYQEFLVMATTDLEDRIVLL